jgi:D-alanine-D-alanine ligase
MRVAVLYNAVAPNDTIEDRDVLVQVGVVRESLKRLGHADYEVACTLDLELMSERLRHLGADVVFNLVEALKGDDSLIHLAPAVLDSLGMAYTGSGAESLFLTTHKLLAKERVFCAGLPTPRWILADESGGGPHPDPLPTNRPCFETMLRTTPRPAAPEEGTLKTWIMKGIWEQGSRDMGDDAVVTGSLAEVQRRLKERMDRTGRAAFAEEFIEGREINVALLGGGGGVEALPAAEVDFSSFPPQKPRIVGYSAKWLADSFEYKNTPHRFDFPPADRPLLDELDRLARKCWDLFMLRGWARVDFRVDQSGRPWILEVNANPCLSPDAGFMAALERRGTAFDQAIERILQDALGHRGDCTQTMCRQSAELLKEESA